MRESDNYDRSVLFFNSRTLTSPGAPGDVRVLELKINGKALIQSELTLPIL